MAAPQTRTTHVKNTEERASWLPECTTAVTVDPVTAEAERRAHNLEKRRTYSGSSERPPRATDPQNQGTEDKAEVATVTSSHGLCGATVKIPRRNCLRESDACVPAAPPTPERQCPRW